MSRLLSTILLAAAIYMAAPSDMRQPHIYTQSKLAAELGVRCPFWPCGQKEPPPKKQPITRCPFWPCAF